MQQKWQEIDALIYTIRLSEYLGPEPIGLKPSALDFVFTLFSNQSTKAKSLWQYINTPPESSADRAILRLLLSKALLLSSM
ncbi:hypothetical protein PCO82_17175 [Pectobacteriaceae bacterium CE90]|nr:hypothetical protein PCO82_17175 [Pectobacteriaceae bacterium CE90]